MVNTVLALFRCQVKLGARTKTIIENAFSGLSSGIRFRQSANIDGAVFKLHYRLTAVLLFGFCFLITARGLVGDPINCVRDENSRLQDDVVNTYCWIHTTFTLPKYYHKATGKDTAILYPGVGPDQRQDDKTYHAYYQWVPFVLFIQGLMFYLPHWLWKVWEGGKMNAMVMGLSNPLINPEERREKINILSDYMKTTKGHHSNYAIKFFLCEILNLTISLGNFFFLNAFLGGLFLNFGVEVTNYLTISEEERSDPLIVLFPRITKCTFLMYGYSGTIEKHDLMCVLALNILNEKIYIFLWFWLILLIILGGLSIIFRFLVLCMPRVRVGLLQKRIKLSKCSNFNKIMRKNLNFGDTFVLNLLSKNIDILAFSAIMEELCIKIETKTTFKEPESYSLLGESV